jgi:serine/threonine-protein kinase
MNNTQLRPPLSSAQARQIDQACDRFEAAWKTGQRPRPQEYLDLAGEPGRSALLRQLLFLDWDYRRRAGEYPRAGDYQTRFPGDLALIEDVSREMMDVHRQAEGVPETPARAAQLPLPAGRFLLGEELARGGMGVVYRAHDSSLGRDVAVKVLQEHYSADSEVGGRFLDEARITAQLQHPAIPPVFEVGRLADDRPYLAMKLIKGRTLEELLKERSGPAADRARFLAVFQQICQAVGYAQSKHILHRDLKPANVMVGAFGEVQVMDWGLAKVLGWGGSATHEPSAGTVTTCGTEIQTARQRDSATQAGSVLGTPSFMSPEQAGGEVDKLDERADVFGLGAILCVILTGEPPYVGNSAEEVRLMAIRGTLTGAEARLARCGADAKLVELCRQCLAADRESRPRDATAVAGTLAGYLAGVEERARSAEVELAAAATRAAEQRKRRRVQLALAASVLVLAGLVGFGLWWQDRLEAKAAAERDVRESRTTAGVSEALREARRRVEEAWNLADFPDRMQHATDVAVAALRRGEGFASGGAPEQTTHDLAAARQEVDELTRYTLLINARSAIVHQFAEEVTGHGWFEPQVRLARRYAKALQKFGLDPIHDPAREVAQTVAFSRLRDDLLGMLLDWHWHDKGQHRNRLWEVIRISRKLCGGNYARWQKLVDDRDVRGLVAFAASPAGLSFRSILAGALFRDLRDAQQFAACQTFLRAAAERYPHEVWLHFDLADICRRMKPPEYTEALRHSAAATVQRPESAVCHLQLGDCYASLGSYDQALAAYRKSNKLARGKSLAFVSLLNLADALVQKKEWGKALAAVEEAIRVEPKSMTALGKRTEVLYASGRYAEALRAAVAVLREHPKLSEDVRRYFRYHAACFAMKIADGLGANPPLAADRPAYRQQAFELLTANLAANDKAAATQPAGVHRVMQHWLGNKDLASVRDQTAVGRLPVSEREAWNNLWAKVRALCERTAPRVGPARDGVGPGDGNAEQAIASYRRRLKLDPRDAKAHDKLGALLLEVKYDYDGAASHFRMAAKLEPNDPRYHYHLGLALGRQGRLDEAIVAFRETIRLKPDLAQAHYGLGVALHKQGDFEQAAACYRDALRHNPNYLPAQTALRNLGKKSRQKAGG